jgi:hypothetical protein
MQRLRKLDLVDSYIQVMHENIKEGYVSEITQDRHSNGPSRLLHTALSGPPEQ